MCTGDKQFSAAGARYATSFFFSPPFSVFFGLIEPIAAHDGVTGAYETVRRTVLPSVPAFFSFFFFAIPKIWSPRAGGPKAYAETLLSEIIFLKRVVSLMIVA